MIGISDEAGQRLLATELWAGLDWHVSATHSVALLDWSSLLRASHLVSGEILFEREAQLAGTEFGRPVGPRPASHGYVFDPFVAVADLAAIVAAAVFYDRIVVVHPWRNAGEHFAVLGIAGFAHRLDPGDRGSDAPAAASMGHLLQDTWGITYAAISNTWRNRPDWLVAVETNWTNLLSIPSPIDLDSHQCNYTSSPAQPTWPVFEAEHGSWVHRASRDLAGLARDNTYRGAFYMRLADELTSLLSFDQHDVEVRYVGGCLRAPVQLAILRGDMIRGLPLEFELDRRGPPSPVTIRMPFWFSAVMNLCHSRQEFSSAVATLRDMAEPLRRRRKELGDALSTGDLRESVRVADAMKTAFMDLDRELVRQTPRVIGAAAGVMASTSVIAGSAEGAKSTLELLGKPLVRWVRRRTRPHISAIQELSDTANGCMNVLLAAARVFHLPASFAGEPAEFLRRLGQLWWVA